MKIKWLWSFQIQLTLVPGSQVILTTLMISWIINMIKESEIDELSVSLNGLWISHLLAYHQAELSIWSETSANQTMGLADLNEAVKIIKKEEINTFCQRSYIPRQRSCFWAATYLWWCRPWQGGDRPCLPHCLNIMHAYTEMTTGSKWVAVIVKNLTAALIIITKQVKITQVVAANVISELGVVPGKLQKFDEMHGVQRAKM